MDHYFKSHGYLPEGSLKNSRGQTLDIAAMPAILRTLLVTDGTVTKTLEAYFWESIAVAHLEQDEVSSTSPLEFLENRNEEALLDRRIRLVGNPSNITYAYAHSFIRLDVLPTEFRADLKSGKIGIGEILRETGLETYRELVDLGEDTIKENAGNNSDSSSSNEMRPSEERIIYRTYRIMINHNPAILVTEKFPVSVYQK